MGSLVQARKAKRKERRRNRHDWLFFQSVLWVGVIFALSHVYTSPSKYSTYVDESKMKDFSRSSPDYDAGVEPWEMPFGEYRNLRELSNATVDECVSIPSQKEIDCKVDDYCITDAYPRDWFTMEQLEAGGLATHFLVM